ncbi:MAG TPA: DnaB-like helicase C-terminal domain-containing protein [Desulfovibrio sp.]|uniref:replicative DNA helicase n=1 Tax=Desulfovibrio sp. TaxID=885 RepID=UPI002D6FCF7F|nr:DnaB-like helicase C-terminal domain-containing protein [Desulfovibrio sp.]HZF62720.1 DnaB-like helicase C-terminal domain-containing protein [Desulfovibrio sp.]
MSQIINVIEQRREAERDFVNAAFCGIVQRVIEPDAVLAVCPASLLSHDYKAKAVYDAISAIAADHKRPDPVCVWEWIFKHSSDYPPMCAADVADYCTIAIMGSREDSILHLAEVVRREGLKQQAESKLMGLLSDCQRYGNDAAEVAAGAAKLAEQLEDGCTDRADYSLSAIMRRVVVKLESGEAAKPMPTPWSNLNRVLKGGIAPGELAILAARPGVGKTALAGCFGIETARAGHPVMFVSREVKDETVAARIMSREAKIDSRIFREGIQIAPDLMPKIRKAQSLLDSAPIEIIERSIAPMTPREVRRLAKARGQLGLIVIDYLQLMEPDNRSNSREREVAEMSRAFKQLALDCNCPVLLLSQMSRKAEEENREPRLSDLRESGAIEQDADIVIFLHTPRQSLESPSPDVKVKVAKGRSSGAGSCWMRFEKLFSNFYEIPAPLEPTKPQRGKDNGL